MTPEARRRWILVGVAVAAFLALGLAWWLLPGPRDLERELTPEPASIDVPELPPLPPEPQSDASDDTDPPVEDTAGDEVGVAGGGLQPLLAGVLDPDQDVLTDDGVPLRLAGSSLWFRDAVLPADSQPVALALSSTALLTELRGPDGSYVQILLPDLPERRVIRLDGVVEAGLQAAKARDPVATPLGFALLAEDPVGSAVWRVDLEVATATVLARPPGAARVDHLRAGPSGGLSLVADANRVLSLRSGNWFTEERGPAGLDGLGIGAGPTLVTTRLGQVWLNTPSRTVSERMGPGREPVRLPGATAWIRGGDVVIRPDGAASDEVVGRARSLPGADLVVADSQLFWLRPDGALGRLDLSRGASIEAFLLPVTDVSALAANITDGTTRVALAGRNDTVQQVEVIELP